MNFIIIIICGCCIIGYFHCYVEKILLCMQWVNRVLYSQDGYAAVEHIKQGMRIEVQDETNPLHHWVATVSLQLRWHT
jgi:hypothetical protein